MITNASARLCAVAALCAIAAANQSAIGQFAPRVSINVGGGAYGLAAGDFNGDGRPDLAAGNNNQFQLKVFYGQPNGTLGTPTTLNTSDIPIRMTAGDLNGDGRSDLVFNDAGFSLAYGQANNTFNPVTHFSPGGYKFVATDLNGDGPQDIVMTSGPLVRVHFGQVGGGFTGQTFAAGSNGRGIAVQDFNADGRKDIVTTNEDGNYSMTMMTALPGGGYSNTTLPGGRSESLLSADFNHDNRPDIAYSVFHQGAGVKLGQPGGGFSATTFYPTTDSAFDIASGDFNHDGKVDLALVTVNYNTVSLLLGNGNGTFTASTVLQTSANGSAAIVSSDFNGDGWDDIAVASASGPNVDVFYQIPEPGMAIPCLFMSAIALLRRRKRG